MCLLTMKKAMTSVPMLFFLLSRVLDIFGKMTVVRGPIDTFSSTLMCFSDDDGSALVWNIYSPEDREYWRFFLNIYRDHKSLYRFRQINSFRNNKIDCKMMRNEKCLSAWDTRFWNFTDSLMTPMGPVFDQRWEEFDQKVKYENISLEDYKAVTLPFSIRGYGKLDILLCNKQTSEKPCYFSETDILENGTVCFNPRWFTPVNSFQKDAPCKQERVELNHTIFSINKWQTFIIMYNSSSMSLYDTNNLIYVRLNFNPESRYILIKSSASFLRFHIYHFLHTTVEGAILTSPSFQFYDMTICIQFMIGLCAKCDAEIMLRNSVSNETLEQVKVQGLSTAYGAPMWQFVKIKKSLSRIGHINVTIQLNPKLKSHIHNPLWAIADVRQCPPNGSLRWSKVDTSRFPRDIKFTCQKLFYKEHITVNATATPRLNMELDDIDCPVGYIGPQCLVSCSQELGYYYLESNLICKGTAICYKNGCVCSRGFTGEKCTEECNSGTYGYACKKKCGTCAHKNICNKITGECTDGCDNKEKIYVAPFCQIALEKPNSPNIITSTKTSIKVNVPVIWKDEYEKAELFYVFSIREEYSKLVEYTHTWKKLFRNMTHILEYFKNLKPATIYQIRCSFSIGPSNKQKINGDWKTVSTDCEIADFQVTSEETNLWIDWRKNANQSYPCPANWYHLKVQDIKTNILMNETSLSFPYKFQHLKPYTLYKVTIYLKNKKMIFSREKRTLESVPSKVLNLQSNIWNDTYLNLFWTAPEQPNGKIVQYKVILKVEEYIGCRDLMLSTLDNHITTNFTSKTSSIAISKLHPYTKYSVQVKACNSRNESESAKINVSMLSSEIPVVKFSRPKVENWKLLWSSPKDCTMISGPIIAKIKIRGISEAVKNCLTTKETKINYINLINLYGSERYVATIYAIRNYRSPENRSAYEEIEFETPPKAPPIVTNLDVVEINPQKTPMTIYLRWQSPSSPFNGILNRYAIYFYDSDNHNYTHIDVRLNEYCDLWENYICKIIQTPLPKIHVVAFNVNVSEPSPAAYVTERMLNTKPDAPRNYTIWIDDHSVVNLKWLHPWRTGNPLHFFRILIEEKSSNLIERNFSRSKIEIRTLVESYKRDYTKRLYLQPSTHYNIAIQSVTIAGVFSNVEYVEFRTPPSVDFSEDVKFKVNESTSTISLNIPPVVNDTRDSVLHVIVKGTDPCEQYVKLPANLSAQLGIKMYEIAWQAAEVSTGEIAGQEFTIGDNNTYGNGTNCPLRYGKLYEITIIVTERNMFSESIILNRTISTRIGSVISLVSNKMWLILIILFLIIVVAAFSFYRRKRRKSINRRILQESLSLSHYNFDNCEHDITAEILNSEQSFSTSSDGYLTPISRMSQMRIEANDETEKSRSLVKVKDFEDYVKQVIRSGLLDKQYGMFPTGELGPCDYGKLPQNKSKNRYGKIIAYDDTRVILSKLPKDVYSDYINANYITGYKKQKNYIATQGPKANTVVDFWRMIWQEKVLIICMLTNLIEHEKTKCEQYWPEIGTKKKYGDIVVLNAEHSVFADYTFRTLHVTFGKEARKVEHFHYTAWPDYGVPLYTHSVVMYLKKLLATAPGDGPMVVHCSDGVGRTGTIILCDICLHRAAAEGVVDVFAEAASIRRERINMVNNKQLYLLAHLTLVESLFSIPMTLPCDETLPMRIAELKKQLLFQQQRLQDAAWQDEALRQVTCPIPLSKCNRAKNRFPEMLSDKINRIYLKRYPLSDEDSDYLSGVYVDGVRLCNQYLATQLPMPSTIKDFWRMVAEFKVELILMLQPPDIKDPTCCIIAPLNGEFKPTPYLNVIMKETVRSGTYMSQKLLLVDNSEKISREQSVTILCFIEWKPGRNQPPPPVASMVAFWQDAEKISRGDGPTVTLCYDGVTGCGLYLALSFLLERMAVERECDVCLAVRAVRRSRPDFVQFLDHLEYLYDAAATYLEYFETYANFT